MSIYLIERVHVLITWNTSQSESHDNNICNCTAPGECVYVPRESAAKIGYKHYCTELQSRSTRSFLIVQNNPYCMYLQ
jgi:hypothetical protein